MKSVLRCLKFVSFALVLVSASSALAQSRVILDDWFSSPLDGMQSRFQLTENGQFYHGAGDVGTTPTMTYVGRENEPSVIRVLQRLIGGLQVPSNIETGDCPTDFPVPNDGGGEIYVYGTHLPGGRVNLWDLTLDCNARLLSSGTVTAARDLIEYMQSARQKLAPQR